MFSNLASYIFGDSKDEEASEAFNKVRLMFNSKAKQNERLAAIIFITYNKCSNFPSLA